jgi:hypothetical protein
MTSFGVNKTTPFDVHFQSGYENSIKGITYEEFISTARDLITDQKYLRLLQYLEDRYIIK